MSETTAATKRKRHPKWADAVARFAQMASAMTVSAELGVPYNTVYPWWRKHQGKPITRRAKVAPSDADHGDEATP